MPRSQRKKSSCLVLSSPSTSPEFRATHDGLNSPAPSPPRPATQRKTSQALEAWKTYLRSIHDLPVSIDTMRGLVAKLYECKDGAKSTHLSHAVNMVVVRPPDLRRGNITIGEYLYPSGVYDKNGNIKDKPYAAYIPSLISQCSSSSHLAVVACKHCAANRGAFTSCRVDPWHGGCCLNCWHSRSIWDCTLHDSQGLSKPTKKRKIAVKDEIETTPLPSAQTRKCSRTMDRALTPASMPETVQGHHSTMQMASTPALTPEPPQKRRRTDKAAIRTTSPVVAENCRSTRHSALVLAPTPVVAQVPLSDAEEEYATLPSKLGDDETIEVENIQSPKRDYSLLAIAALLSRPVDSTLTEVMNNDTVRSETPLGDLECIGDASTAVWDEDAADIETQSVLPWLRQASPPSDATKSTLFAGTRKRSEMYYVDLKLATTPDALRAPPTKKMRLLRSPIMRTPTSAAAHTLPNECITSPLARNPRLAPIFTPALNKIPISVTTRPVPPWQTPAQLPAGPQNTPLSQGTRKSGELFYTYFKIDKGPDTSLVATSTSTPSLIHTQLAKPSVKYSKQPGTGTNLLKSFARHALNYIFD